MKLKGIISEDFVNYKNPSMTLMFPLCMFKCGYDVCQNKDLFGEPDIEIEAESIADRYLENPITEAIVLQGLEPFDSFDDVLEIIQILRDKKGCLDDIVIYTGYTEEECKGQIEELKRYDNIIVKFGRYIPNQKPHKDEVLGVELCSDNQYAVSFIIH